MKQKASLAFCDKEGHIYKHPWMKGAFRTGRRFVLIDKSELIKLPEGSIFYLLPHRYPVGGDNFKVIKKFEGKEIWAVSAFLSSGYLRTYLPAYIKKDNAPILSLWAYCGIVFIGEEIYVPALRIDPDPRSDPALHKNEKELLKKIKDLKKKFPNNTLVKQLVICSTQYGCLCARNFFLSRYEAPLPISKSCNARCLGCFSFQEETGVHVSQYRIAEEPSAQEIAEVIGYHFKRVDKAIASFGQGCEGEPLLRAKAISKAIALVREKTSRGTINLNTNGSLPHALKSCIEAGLDSVRISLNSPTEKYYTLYFRPRNYQFTDVLKSLEFALNSGIFVSINLFFLPGFTDSEGEVKNLCKFLDKFPVNMIQTRNLNIDPDYYLDGIGFQDEEPLGIRRLIDILKKKYPFLTFGYYNPPKEHFHRKC